MVPRADVIYDGPHLNRRRVGSITEATRPDDREQWLVHLRDWCKARHLSLDEHLVEVDAGRGYRERHSTH